MKKPYIEKYESISKFNVWIVDGNYIRTNINKEFTNFGQHYQFGFIPKNEFWIDKEYGKSEEKYFIKDMLVMYKLLSKKINYRKAIKEAEEAEEKERKREDPIFKKKKLTKEEIYKKIHKKLIKKYSKKIKVWVVRGDLVRDLFFLEFTEGGHDLVYPFIPKNEIWLDDDLSKRERKFVLLHEAHERNLMSKGYCYDTDDPRTMTRSANKKATIHRSAHKSASKIEFYCRKHPKKTKKALMNELNQEIFY